MSNPVAGLSSQEFIALMELFLSSELALNKRLNRATSMHLNSAVGFAKGLITLSEFRAKCESPFTLEQLKGLMLPALFIFVYLRAMEPCTLEIPNV